MTSSKDGQPVGRNDASGARLRFTPPRAELNKLFDRLPPAAPEAEMSLLGSMILDHTVVADVIPIVSSAGAFNSEANATVFQALLSLYEHHHGGDMVQLTQALRDCQELEAVGGVNYLVSLAQSVPSASNAKHYARIVREKYQLRRLIDAAGLIVYEAYNEGLGSGARAVLDRAESLVFEIAEEAEAMDDVTLAHLLQQAMDTIMANEGRLVTGLSTGFHDLDEMTSGLQPGEMIIVAARPSMGKTALALNLAEQIAFGGHRHTPGSADPRAPIAFFSLEMSMQAVTQRLLSSHSRVDSHLIRTNRLSKQHYHDLQRSCGILAEAPIHVVDTPGLTVMQMRAKARRLVKQHKIQCIVIDYLQLMSAPQASREGRQQEVSTISRQIKALARDLRIPVICLAQLNRGAEQREGHRPRMADLRESGSIEQDADVVALLHREEYYHTGDADWARENPDKIGIAELIIAKQRNGPTGTVELSWDSSVTRFGSKASGYSAPSPHRPASQVEPRPQTRTGASSGFASRQRTGPEADHRDGGGPDQDWDTPSDIPI
ncbi:MAG: replicative DNA helicase [Phycisphaerales bacterium]|nr:replicative DNA helicase [Phycisphaerales bacterium]